MTICLKGCWSRIMAFKIVNKAWEYSHQYGYKCTFERGVLHLHFNFRRIFYRTEDLNELHMTIMRGIQEKYDTPFFTALKEYSKRPMGVFHAMPISRGNSVFKSRWIQDFGEFY